MTYDELTTEQKARLAAHTTQLRALAGSQAKLNNAWEILEDDYNIQVSDILDALDVGEIIPNASGLSQAAPLTKEEVVTIESHGQGITTTYNTVNHRQLWVKAAGIANTIG